MKTHARTLIIVLAALGLGASVAALYVHYQMLADPTYTSFCDVNETVSCEAVLTSQYGSVAGVPVAAGGAIWSALILLLAVFGMTPARSEKAGAVAGLHLRPVDDRPRRRRCISATRRSSSCARCARSA